MLKVNKIPGMIRKESEKYNLNLCIINSISVFKVPRIVMDIKP